MCLWKVGEWESSYSLFWGSGDAARGYSGQQATPERRALWGGWESITSKCPPSWSFHCSTSLSCFVGLDLTLDISLSLHITLNNCHPYKKKQRAIKLAKPFGRASYIPALWECILVSIMHSRGCFCDMGSPVLLPCDLWEASRRRGRNRNFGIWFFIVFLQRCGNIQQKYPLTFPGLLSLVYFYHAITLSTRNPCVLCFLCTHMFLKLSRGKDTPTRTTHTHTHRNTFTPQRLRAYEANQSTDTHTSHFSREEEDVFLT